MSTPHLGKLAPFNTIGGLEWDYVQRSLSKPLSGYIGGDPMGGYWVQRLAEEWNAAFGTPYAIPCNSATSGLLAACMAVGVQPDDEVWTTPYSMSATAACAKVLGARVRFIDIEPYQFGINPELLSKSLGGILPRAIIVTNLFGHPAKLRKIREWCGKHSVYMIEDNAQAPFATEHYQNTGTVGHIGVFSLNVHKHIQCGEGGVIVTSDTTLMVRLQGCINHGELDPAWPYTGLNLRMTEPIAAIACAQLSRAGPIIDSRREIGLALCDMVKDISWIKAHTDQPRCKHVYYLWTALMDSSKRRGEFVTRLNERGVPIRAKYAPLLHRLFKSGDHCPVVEDVDNRIVVFEVCAYDPTSQQIKLLADIIKRVAGDMHEDRAA